MPRFTHDRLNFYYEEHGRGLPFVFSHGLAGNTGHARELLGPVDGCRLILYDNRGHGRTAEPGDVSRLNFSTLADDVVGLLNHLSIEKAVIGGVSMGAGVAIAFCLKHAHRTQAAVFVRPAWLNQPAPPNLAMFPAIAAMIQELGIERARQRFEQSEIFAAWKKSYPPAEQSVEGLFSGRSAEAIVASYLSIPRSAPYRSAEELKRIDVSALVLANRNDPLHPFEYAEALARALPNAQLKEFPSKTDGLERHTSAFRLHLHEFLHNVAGRHPALA
jgi:pimeloyl-ACP methyl ester carboxylesterase